MLGPRSTEGDSPHPGGMVLAPWCSTCTGVPVAHIHRGCAHAQPHWCDHGVVLRTTRAGGPVCWPVASTYGGMSGTGFACSPSAA